MTISVITINFNHLEGLKKTVQSVKEQTYNQIEYIIIDGGSSDGSKKYIQDNAELLDYWVSESDNGLYNAMNKGIARASGDYLIFMNSGDYFCNSNVVEQVVNKGLSADFEYGDFYNGSLAQEKLVKFPEQPSLLFFSSRALCHQSLFIKKEIFDLYGGYDENYKIASDWEHYVRLFFHEKVTFKYLDFPIAFYELNGVSAQEELKNEERIQVIREVFPPETVDLVLKYRELKAENWLLKDILRSRIVKVGVGMSKAYQRWFR